MRTDSGKTVNNQLSRSFSHYSSTAVKHAPALEGYSMIIVLVPLEIYLPLSNTLLLAQSKTSVARTMLEPISEGKRSNWL